MTSKRTPAAWLSGLAARPRHASLHPQRRRVSLDVVEHQEQAKRHLFAFFQRPIGVQTGAALGQIARGRGEHGPGGADLGGHAQVATLMLPAWRLLGRGALWHESVSEGIVRIRAPP